MTWATTVASCAAIFPRTRSVWSARRRWSATTVCWQPPGISAPSPKQSGSTLPARPLNGISPAFLSIGWSRRRDSFPATCVLTFKLWWTNCSPFSAIRFFGIQERHRYETLTFASLTSAGQAAHAIAPAQYHDVEIGEAEPVKCLDNGLWLCSADDLHYTVCSLRIANMAKKRASASKSRYLQELQAQSSCGAASAPSRTRSTPRTATAARSCRSMAARIIADGREASWSIKLPPVDTRQRDPARGRR